MDWGVKENRIAVIALHKVGQSPSSIFKLLQNLNITRQFVYRTIERFNKAGTINDLERSGRSHVQRIQAAIKAIRERIRGNPCSKQKILAKKMNLAPRTVSRIINEDLGLRAFKRRTGHLIAPALRYIRRVRSKMLLAWHDGRWHERILFTDEKIFTVEEKINRQNDRIYARSSLEVSLKSEDLKKVTILLLS
ncbi:WNT5B [Cordylochernes scorpioides]|uniref:WNT5B n=1 Tax=Cordylochernes scorpioides TaxID=51811 RepID=A0ABY6K7Y4_9ARAC|nr:WNT5B [Cordylochernes scorpioides]